MPQTVEQFCAVYIPRWETGKHSLDPNDNGNWYLPGAATQKKGQGTLVGSKWGMTGATLARARGVRIITQADMAALTLAEACAIAKRFFYTGTGIDRLQLSRPALYLMDFGWGTGPVPAIKALQDCLNVGVDGVIGVGGETARAFKARLDRSEDALMGMLFDMRNAFYEKLVARRPSDGVYLNGWENRSDWFMPGHPEGWYQHAA